MTYFPFFVPESKTNKILFLNSKLTKSKNSLFLGRGCFCHRFATCKGTQVSHNRIPLPNRIHLMIDTSVATMQHKLYTLLIVFYLKTESRQGFLCKKGDGLEVHLVTVYNVKTKIYSNSKNMLPQ